MRNFLSVDLNQKRIFGLDLLRFLAIIMVLISHGRLLLKSTLGSSIDFLSLGGFWGVELFFVLSGFLIGGILIKIYEPLPLYDFNTIKSFWKRRWFRTLPNYYLVLILNIILALILGKFVFDDLRYYSFFIFSQNLFTEHPNFFGEAWSLAVEEWFYLVYPVVLFFTCKLSPVSWNNKRKLLFSIILVFLFSFVLKIIISFFLNINWDSNIRRMAPLRLDSILTGVLFSWFNFYYHKLFNKYKTVMLIISILFLSISGYNYFKDIVEGGMFGTSFFSKTFYFNITSLGFAFLLPYANYSKSSTPKSIWKKTVTIISLISYSMYLIHYSFILVFLRKIFTGNSSVIIAISIFILYFLITIFFSILLYNFYEKPMTDLRDFETNKKGLLFVKEYLKKAFKTLKVAFN